MRPEAFLNLVVKWPGGKLVALVNFWNLFVAILDPFLICSAIEFNVAARFCLAG